ncbi:DUF350 domain-containing protein [Aquimarina longa]|uniref:DUF350 domain-containing protein n=1 Tax=Aquimarina longa TaxID=1080221 RepID=UPI000781E5FF|nr:DUF350 domain-containing protein [Aquimarina longa]
MELLKNYPYLLELLVTTSYFIEAIIIFALGKIIYQLLNSKIKVNEELVIKDNFAFSVSYVGYFVGLLIVIGASIVGESVGWMEDLLAIAYYSSIGIVLLNVSIWINHKFIINKFNIKKEIIVDQNVGTGVIEAAIMIAAALVLFGAITGESESLFSGTITAILYWAIGMIILIITSKMYIISVRYDVHSEIEKDNVAAGLALAGAIVAISIVVMNALLGDFENWQTTLIDVGTQTIVGLLALPVMRIVADKILLPGQRLTDEIMNQEKPNVGAALVEAFAYIGAAILITWSL